MGWAVRGLCVLSHDLGYNQAPQDNLNPHTEHGGPLMAASIERPRQLSDYNLTGEYGALAVQRGLADAKWYASPIPKDKMRALLERRDGPAVRDTIIWFGLFIAFGAAGAALWGTWWAVI